MNEANAATITLTAEIVAAYVSNNSVAVTEMPALIKSIHASLAGVNTIQDEPAAEPISKPTPAQIRKSITHDALVSFVDGRRYKTLKRHLTGHGMTIAEYKDTYGLPNDYPTTAPSYSEARSAMAKALGLGQGGRKVKSPPKASAKGRVAKA